MSDHDPRDIGYIQVRQEVARRLRKRLFFYAHLAAFVIVSLIVMGSPPYGGLFAVWRFVVVVWFFVLVGSAIRAVWRRIVDNATERELRRRGLMSEPDAYAVDRYDVREKPKRAVRLSDDGELIYLDEHEDARDEAAWRAASKTKR